jgi:hypothetical protein
LATNTGPGNLYFLGLTRCHYAELLEIINNPEHEEYEEMLEWLGGEHFDMREVGFDNPDKRRKFAFG